MAVLTEVRKHLRLRTRKDLITVVVIAIVSFAMAANFDLLEMLYQLTRRYEYLELDELLPSFFFLALAIGWFSYRRWKDSRFVCNVLDELVLTCPNTHIANRRALKRILAQIAEENQPHHSFILVSVDGLDEIRNKYGLVIAEKAVIEILYLLDQALTREQLIIAFQTGQFIVHTPNLNFIDAQALSQRLSKIHLQAKHQCIRELAVSTASYAISESISEETLIEMLEDNLCL